ncbi:uncharacterized protein LOC111635606 isoform X3 [Centruroides sculpturatus]|uniref:uncharacterized protein LOC111635606 isoform X3 n=1 Tax=Centruroides sculpturatus TaxID=218467 RepID=UPI000C6E6EBF|nr:uncharacterized protein LOC111635606 isoform X3 [Centruroides sculpturatus]
MYNRSLSINIQIWIMAEYTRRRTTFTDLMSLAEAEVPSRPEVEGFLENYERRNYLQIMNEKYEESGQPIHLLKLIGIYKEDATEKEVGEYIHGIMKTIEKAEERQNIPPSTGLLLLYKDVCLNCIEATIDQINSLIATHALEIANGRGLLEEVKVLIVVHDIPERLSHKWLWHEVEDLYQEESSFDARNSILNLSKNVIQVCRHLQEAEFTQSNLQMYFGIKTELNYMKNNIMKLYNIKYLLTVKEYMFKYFGPQFYLSHDATVAD